MCFRGGPVKNNTLQFTKTSQMQDFGKVWGSSAVIWECRIIVCQIYLHKKCFIIHCIFIVDILEVESNLVVCILSNADRGRRERG